MPGFSEFLVMVLNDEALRDDLLAAPNLPALLARTQDLARARSIELSQSELEEIVNRNRQSWLERWAG